MKKTRLAVAALATAALVLSAAPAHATGGSVPSGSIVDVALAASGGGTPDSNPGDYDILVQAVLATQLQGALGDPAKTYTVFAPNDRAFLRLAADLSGSTPANEADALKVITSTLSGAQITDVLLYHVVDGKKLGPIQVLTSRTLTMMNGQQVMPRGITLRDATPGLTDPRLVLWGLNIQAANGVIHTIDRVLVPAL